MQTAGTQPAFAVRRTYSIGAPASSQATIAASSSSLPSKA